MLTFFCSIDHKIYCSKVEQFLCKIDAFIEDQIVGNRGNSRNVIGNCDKETIDSIDDSIRRKVYSIKWGDNSQIEVSWSKLWIIGEKEKKLLGVYDDGIDDYNEDEIKLKFSPRD